MSNIKETRLSTNSKTLNVVQCRDVIATTSGSCFQSKRAYQRRNPSINNDDTSQNVENDVRNAIGRKISEIGSRDVIAVTSGTLFRSKRAYPRRNPSINNEDMSQNVENGVRNEIGLEVSEIRNRDVIAATSGAIFRSKRAYPRRNPSINNEDMSQNVENGVRNGIGLQVSEIRKSFFG